MSCFAAPLFKSKGGSIEKTLFISSCVGGETGPSVFVGYRNLLVEEAILTTKSRPSVVAQK